VVGHAEPDEEGGEQEVAISPALAPQEQREDGYSDQQGVQCVDLGHDGLGPEGRPEPEG
jgi:hypothetical protein